MRFHPCDPMSDQQPEPAVCSSGLHRRELSVLRWLVVGLVLVALGSVSAWGGTADDDYAAAATAYKAKDWKTAATAFDGFITEHAGDTRVPLAKLYLGIAYTKQVPPQHTQAHVLFADYLVKNPEGKYRADALYRAARSSYLLERFPDADKEYSRFLNEFSGHAFEKYVLIDLADVKLQRDEPKQAIDLYRRFLAKFAEDDLASEARYGLARSLEQTGQPDAAIPLYERIIAEGTDDRAARAMLDLAALRFERKRYAESLAMYEQFIERFPDAVELPQARLNVGFSRYRLGEYDKALTVFESLATPDAAIPESLKFQADYWRGLTLKALRRFGEAGTVFETAFTANPKQPLADKLLYQWADSLLRRGENKAARDLFAQLHQEFPKSPLDDDALLFLAEASLRLGDLDQAEMTLTEFETKYPDSSLSLYRSLLRGQLLVERGGEKDLDAARKVFETVLKTTRIPQTANEAKFQLARIEQLAGNHQKATKRAEELISEAGDDLPEAYALLASSELSLGNHPEARNAANEYLSRRPRGPLGDQALMAIAVAEMELGNVKASRSAYETLLERFPESPLIPRGTYTLAEAAYDLEDWAWATDLFQRLIDAGVDSQFHAAGLSGLAWTLFTQERYADAAKTFDQLVTDHPDNPQFTPEAAYKAGHALELAGDLKTAVDRYAAAFESMKPATPAPAGADGEGQPGFYTYRAGLQAARLARQLDDVDRADALYEATAKAFPNAANADRLLDEWALLNYENDRFAKSDQIFQRLVKQFPDSDLADDAALSLAESQLVAKKVGPAEKMLLALLADEETDRDVRELARFHLVNLAVESSDWPLVRERAGTMITEHPQSDYLSEVRYRLGEAFLQLNESEAARKTLTELQGNAPVSAQNASWWGRVYVLLAEAYLREKKYMSVEATADGLRQTDPESPWLYQVDEVLGRAYKNQALFKKSRAAFERAIASPIGRGTETAAKAQFLLAETHLLEKDYRKALLEYLKVAKLYPYPEWQAPALFQAGQTYEELEEWAQAAKTYRNLIADFPQTAYARQAKPLLTVVEKKALDETPPDSAPPSSEPMESVPETESVTDSDPTSPASPSDNSSAN